jgi:hypothetical protein
MDILKGAVDLLGGGLKTLSGPMGWGIDAAGSALGLPPVLTNAVKVAAGVYTGNVVLAADGALGLAQELSKNPPGKTEYVPPKSDAVACEGYAKPREPQRGEEWTPTTQGPSASRPSTGSSHLDPKMRDYYDSLQTLRQNFTYLDGMDGKLDKSISLADLKRLSNDVRVSNELRDAARFLVENPGYFERLDSSMGAGPSQGGSIRDCLNDDRVTLGNVESELLKVKADFARYEGTERPGSKPPPGTGSPPVSTQPPPVSTQPPPGSPRPPPGSPRPPQGGSCPVDNGPGRPGRPGSGSDSSARDIINNPNLSIEDKVQAILMGILQDVDQEILQAMDDLATAQDKRAGIKNDKGNEKALADADSSIEFVQMRLQTLVQKRQQMFDLMSNMSSKFHEMHNHIINNIR